MQPVRVNRGILRNILRATYTPQELHEFVQICYSLALPVIRKRIALGKLRCERIGTGERGIVYDCIADLFETDGFSGFPQIVRFFKSQIAEIDTASDERLLMLLRRLVLGKVNNSIVRLYAEHDPILGRIIRNITIFVEGTNLFSKHLRFGEAYLMTTDAPLCHRPPIPTESLHETFARVASVRDSIPDLLRKLHRILLEQRDYQRVVPFVGFAVMCKEVYARGNEVEEERVLRGNHQEDLKRVIGSVCKKLEHKMYRSYVQTGKKTERVFQCYMAAVRDMLSAIFVERDDSTAYLVYLSRQIPDLTKAVYLNSHRVVFEHIAKTAKRDVVRALKEQ